MTHKDVFLIDSKKRENFFVFFSWWWLFKVRGQRTTESCGYSQKKKNFFGFSDGFFYGQFQIGKTKLFSKKKFKQKNHNNNNKNDPKLASCTFNRWWLCFFFLWVPKILYLCSSIDNFKWWIWIVWVEKKFSDILNAVLYKNFMFGWFSDENNKFLSVTIW